MGCAQNNDGTWKAPLVYRIDIQQGNVVDQAMINKLRPGMDKKQVKFIMGTPLIVDPFHNDRWDYLYSFEPGRGEREQRRITLYFTDEHLARIDGDIKIPDTPAGMDEMQKDRTVAVPLEEDKQGFFKRMFSRNKKSEQVIEESNGAPQEPEATTATVETTAPTGTDAAATGTGESVNTPVTEPVATPDQNVEDTTREPGATPDTQATAGAANTASEKSTAGNPQEKNLLRRFWDRMTKSTVETDTGDEESEQDKRDAEVLEGAGGNL